MPKELTIAWGCSLAARTVATPLARSSRVRVALIVVDETPDVLVIPNNYIYCTVAGFTENDTFRSNQIREGMITRSEAMARIESENQPRWEAMKWYSEAIGFDLDKAIAVINSMPKLYETVDAGPRS